MGIREELTMLDLAPSACPRKKPGRTTEGERICLTCGTSWRKHDVWPAMAPVASTLVDEDGNELDLLI